MDVSGEHHLDVLHSVYKVRLSEDGQPIHEEAEQYDLGAVKEEETEAKEEGNAAKVVKKEANSCGRYCCTLMIVNAFTSFTYCMSQLLWC